MARTKHGKHGKRFLEERREAKAAGLPMPPTPSARKAREKKEAKNAGLPPRPRSPIRSATNGQGGRGNNDYGPPSRSDYDRPPSPRRDQSFRPRDSEQYRPNDGVFRFGAGNSGDHYRPNQMNEDRYRGDDRYDHSRNERNYQDRRRSVSPRGDRRNDYRDDRQGPRDERSNFNFSFNAPGEINRAMQNPQSYPESFRDRNDRGRRNDNSRGRGGRNARGGRGGYVPKRAADRPFLQGNREPTPELMRGMDEDATNPTKFRNIQDLSDSDEEDMDMSDDDRATEDDESEQPRKKQARGPDSKAADGNSIPRWSNPDPYTALPPPDESQRKKKDVVKLIRKARMDQTNDEFNKSAAATDDFISFDFDDDDNKDKESSPEPEINQGVAGAPSGPRSLRKDNMYPPASLPTNLPFATENPPEMSVNEELGNRKRTYDDQIKGPPLIVKKKGKQPASNGRVAREWLPKNDPTPWCVFDHSPTERMGDWLHKEIIDFYDHVKPTEFEAFIRSELLYNLDDQIARRWTDAAIREFGSFPAGLYLPTADMDVVFVSTQYMKGSFGKYDNKHHLFNLKDFLLRKGIAQNDSVECITKAKVPLVKYVDRVTGLRVDVSFENETGLIANKTFQHWKQQFPAMPILVTLVKQFLTMRGLNEPVNGGIGGFSVICLVVSLLQLMPQIQSGNMIPEHHLGEILMEFFDLYGNQFNTMTTGIRMVPPGYLAKRDIRNAVYKLTEDKPKFCIIDPNDDSNDIAGGASNTVRIQSAFSEAYNALRDRMDDLESQTIEERKGQSILGVILGGDYISFELQREHLRYLHSLNRNAAAA